MAQTTWSTAEIKFHLARRGLTLSAVDRKNGLVVGSSRYALKAKGFPLAEQAIAEAIGVEPHVIWPDRWFPDGTRIDLRIRDHNTRLCGDRERPIDTPSIDGGRGTGRKAA